MFGFCWHKWKKVYRVEHEKFFDKTCPQYILEYRICTKCGKAQSFEETYDSVYWNTLDECHRRILLDNIIDVDECFILKKTPKEEVHTDIEIGATYKHFKGNYYKVISLAKHTETGETLVIYQNVNDPENNVWARPISMWSELVKVDGKQVPRFEKTK